MDARAVVKLQFGDSLLGIEEAIQRFPDPTIRAIESAHHTTRLHDIFHKSLRSSRNVTPYRLNAAVASCVQGLLPQDALEMDFFREGKVKAVTALATALKYDKSTLRLLRSLPPEALNAFIASLAKIEPHPDFRAMCLRAEASASKPVDQTYVAGSRPS